MLSRMCDALLVLAFAAAAWAAFGAVIGAGVSTTILLALAIHVWAGKSRWSRSSRVAAAMLGLSALVWLLVPAIIAARETALCSHCKNNLRQIGLALVNYWDSHKCFPPASTYDKTGRPVHSWRLLIKPFIDATAAYYRYNFNEPWDAPSNRKVLAERQSQYKCPADEMAYARDSSATSYVAVVGRWTPSRWDTKKSPDDQDLQKQTANSFLVIETANSGIQWLEPKDIRFDDHQALRPLLANSPHLRDNGYFFCKTPAVNAMLVEVDRIFIFPLDSATSVLTGLVPPDETRTRPKQDKPSGGLYVEELRLHWPHCIGLPAWIAAFGLLFYQVQRHGRGPRP